MFSEKNVNTFVHVFFILKSAVTTLYVEK